jgi:hypothetical protein
MKYPTIKESFSALTIWLSESFQDRYSVLSYYPFTTSNAISSFLVVFSNLGSCHYEY